jgi:ADP-ribosylglycohydrolase
MLGAIIGDIIGSPYEGLPIKTTSFPLFSAESRPTDDSILTIATADAILSGASYSDKYREYGTEYAYAGYGGMFRRWLLDRQMGPYNSFGNGSAMRVSPVGWAFDKENEVIEQAELTAKCTHNHPEGIKGAVATAVLIHAARMGKDKAILRDLITREFHYNVDASVDEIRPAYGFDITCPGTVPQAFRCVYEAENYEQAVRLAVSLGGDSDTLACISGSIAEALWEIPDAIEKEGMEILTRQHPKLIPIISTFRNRIVHKQSH